MDLNNITAEQQKGLEFLKVRFQAELDDIRAKIQQLNKPFPDDLTTHLQNSFLNKELLFSPSQQIGLKKDQRREQLEKLKGDENERQYLGRIKLSLEKFAEAGMRQDLENKLLGIVQNSKLTSNKRMSAFFCLMHSLGFGFKRTSDFIVWAFGQMWVYENRRIAKERKAKLKQRKQDAKGQDKLDGINAANQDAQLNAKTEEDSINDDSKNLSEQQKDGLKHDNISLGMGGLSDLQNKNGLSMGLQSGYNEKQMGDGSQNDMFPKLQLSNMINKEQSQIGGLGLNDHTSADNNYLMKPGFSQLKSNADYNLSQNMQQFSSQNMGGLGMQENTFGQGGFTGASAFGTTQFQGNQSITFIDNKQSGPKNQNQQFWLPKKDNKTQNNQLGGANQFATSIQDPTSMNQNNMQFYLDQQNQQMEREREGSEYSPKNKDYQNGDKKDQMQKEQMKLYQLIQVKLSAKIKSLEEEKEEKVVTINQLMNLCESQKNTFQRFLISLFQLLQQQGVSQEIQNQIQNLARQYQYVNTSKNGSYENNMDPDLQNIINNNKVNSNAGNGYMSYIDMQQALQLQNQQAQMDSLNQYELNSNQMQFLQNTKIEPKVEHVMQGDRGQSDENKMNQNHLSNNHLNNNLLVMSQHHNGQNNTGNSGQGYQTNFSNLGGISLTSHMGMQSNLGMQLNPQFNLLGGQNDLGHMSNDINSLMFQQGASQMNHCKD